MIELADKILESHHYAGLLLTVNGAITRPHTSPPGDDTIGIARKRGGDRLQRCLDIPGQTWETLPRLFRHPPCPASYAQIVGYIIHASCLCVCVSCRMCITCGKTEHGQKYIPVTSYSYFLQWSLLCS